MTDVSELIERLRGFADSQPTSAECADALEAQAREIADLQAGWQRTYDHDVARLQERLAAAERERDEAVALLREARNDALDARAQPNLCRRIDAFLSPDSATHRENDA